jgi:hypothetical protein
MLREFDIRSRQMKFKVENAQRNLKGFDRGQFEDAWQRYTCVAGSDPSEPSTPLPFKHSAGLRPFQPSTRVEGSEGLNPRKTSKVEG